jgi:hypothetical protein
MSLVWVPMCDRAGVAARLNSFGLGGGAFDLGLDRSTWGWIGRTFHVLVVGASVSVGDKFLDSRRTC